MQDITDSPLPSAEFAVLQTATRDLVGVALRSLDVLDGAVSLPQFRLLVALDELGCTPSSRVAEFLGAVPSSVTRLADRLHDAGHVRRGSDPANRSVVTLELSPSGRQLVAAVLRARRAELGRALDRLDDVQRAELTGALTRLHAVLTAELSESAASAGSRGPVPL